MKVTLRAGAELDLLSADELRRVLDEYRQPERPRYMRVPISQKADGTGNAVIEVYTVPLGRVLTITRVVIEADGYNPGAPYQSPAGYVQVRRQGGQTTDFVSLAAPGGLPAISTDSDSAGGRYLNGETVEVNVVGGAGLANVNLHVLVQGIEETGDDVHQSGSRARQQGNRK